MNKARDLAIPDEVVISKIYLIRNLKVILDNDLADLYQVDTKRLNEQVKRNMALSVRFHVSTYKSGMESFEVANCDFKKRAWWKEDCTLCFY